MCGGQWESLSSTSYLTSTGRLGCCSPGTFMAQPNLNPFNKATACESCPVGNYSGMSDDLNCPYTATTCPGTHAYAVEPASCRISIPDCTYSDSNDRSCGLRQAVDAYIDSDSTGSYGPIEDWDTSLVTDMSNVFRGKSTFNANISAWEVGNVMDMKYSTSTGSFFWLFLFPFLHVFLCACTNFPFFSTHFYMYTWCSVFRSW